jgi:crotonobetainyl-CoA:carnitine CoA-transferase CaiB-like acyl-CoA transferase
VQAVEELLDDPQVLANDYLGEVHLDGGGEYRLPRVPVQFDEAPPPLRRAPEHGEHTESVLLDLGYTWDDIAALQQVAAIP